MTSAETGEQWYETIRWERLSPFCARRHWSSSQGTGYSDINGPEVDVARIIADHKAAAAAGLLLAALREAQPFMTWAPEALREQVRAAIAAAEEAGVKLPAT